MKIIAGILAGTILLASAADAKKPELPQFRIGEPAPAFELMGVDGKKVSSESLKGKPAVLFFAATWCPYSTRKYKAVEKLYKRYKNKGVQVLLVDLKEEKAVVAKKWVEERKMSCPLLLDTDGKVTRAFGPPPDFQPKAAREDLMTSTLILLDKEGKVRDFPAPTENPAEVDWDLKALREKLDALLAAKK